MDRIIVERQDLDSLEEEWQTLLGSSAVSHIFLTPQWVRCWWDHLGEGELYLLALRRAGTLVGIAPLARKGNAISLAADKDVCDYSDIVVGRGEEEEVTRALLDYLESQGFLLDFQPLLPASPLLRHFLPLAQGRGYSAAAEVISVTLRCELPPSWEDYLNSLEGKERHELRRKLRRLHGAGQVSFYTDLTLADEFLSLFRISRPEKVEFLSPRREAFFRSLIKELGKREQLRLYFLEVQGKRIAAALCLDYHDTLYLYNSGFHPDYAHLSPGLLCKVLCLQDAILHGKKVFDFLSGAERYKYRLGGKEVPLYRCSFGRSGRESPLLSVRSDAC